MWAWPLSWKYNPAARDSWASWARTSPQPLHPSQMSSKCHSSAPWQKVLCYANIELAGWQYPWVLILIVKNIPFSLKHWWLCRPLFSLICHHSKPKNLNSLRSHPTEDILHFSPSLFLPLGHKCGQNYSSCTKHECKKDSIFLSQKWWPSVLNTFITLYVFLITVNKLLIIFYPWPDPVKELCTTWRQII